MVNISKRILSDKVLTRIYELFFKLMSKKSSKESFLALTDEIFSPVEKIMIAKRLTIIYLLVKGVDHRNIADILKVSTTTVAKYSLLFRKKESDLVEIIENMLAAEKTVGFIEDVFADIFIQPGLKIGHWDSYWRHKRKQEERKILG